MLSSPIRIVIEPVLVLHSKFLQRGSLFCAEQRQMISARQRCCCASSKMHLMQAGHVQDSAESFSMRTAVYSTAGSFICSVMYELVGPSMGQSDPLPCCQAEIDLLRGSLGVTSYSFLLNTCVACM